MRGLTTVSLLLCSFAAPAAELAPTPSDEPAAQESWPLHLGLSAGAGHAYDFLGLRAEIRYSHLAAFFAIGTPALTRPDPQAPGQEHCPGPYGEGRTYPDSSYAFGARWYQRTTRSGLYGGLQISFRGTCIGGLSDDGDPPGFHNYLTFSATLGYRFRFGHFFLDAGAGPALTYERYGYPGHPSFSGGPIAMGFVSSNLTSFHPVSPVLGLFELGLGFEL